MLDIQLEHYAKSDYYPFHMPGHKRAPLSMPNPYTMDITEIERFDNLHAPESILKDAARRAAELYDSKKSYYLVNGSTCGLLAAVSAAAPAGGKILLARNSHKALYHAAYLRRLSIVSVYPQMTNFDISGSIDPKEVRTALEKNPDVCAVIVTSPTYEGIVSDIREIGKIAHQYKVPLIVDEAHGAHFGFHSAFPETAVRLGADIVIQSMHKTLPSLTQTALLHLNSDFISPEAVEKYLSIYQTSSPSYVLMAGMEKCVRLLKEGGKELFERYVGLLTGFYEKADRLQKLHVMCGRDFSDSEAFGMDLSKIVISARQTDCSGEWLYQKLYQKHHLQMEMRSGFYVLGMTSIMDRPEGFRRLLDALKSLEKEISFIRGKTDENIEMIRRLYAPKKKRMEFFEAMELPVGEVSFQEAAGKICGCMAGLYPPGIPMILPGEAIDGDFIKNIRKCRDLRLNLQGIADIRNERINIVNF